MRTLLMTSLLLLLFVANAHSQVRIVEVDPIADTVTLENYGGSSVNTATYWFCSLLVYARLDQLTIDSGSLNLTPGATVTLSGFALDESGADLGLYLANAFTIPSFMLDFTQWETGGNGRESVAVSKGIWTAGEFVSGTPPYVYNGDGSQNGAGFWSGTVPPAVPATGFAASAIISLLLGALAWKGWRRRVAATVVD